MSKTLRIFLIACLALLPAVSYSQTTGACRIDYLQTQNSVGALVPVIGAKVRICSYNDTTVPCTGLPIYSDPGLTVPITNPITTDGRGRYAYCIVAGNYNEQISGSGIIGVNNQPVSIGGTGSGGGGTGSVLDGSGYKVPFYPAALAATLSPSNITLDSTGNNLNVPGTLAVGGALGTYHGTLQMPTFTANRTWTFPDNSGTVAMTTDIPAVSGYATQSWVTSQNYLTSTSLSGYATQSWVTSQNYLTAYNKTRPCEIHINGSGTGGVIQTGDGDFVNCVNQSGATLTVTSLKCFSDNSGTTAVQLATNAPSNLLTSAVTCSPTGGSGTLNGTPTQADGGWLTSPALTPDGTTKTLVITIGRTL